MISLPPRMRKISADERIISKSFSV
jgi:hypothetical protein